MMKRQTILMLVVLAGSLWRVAAQPAPTTEHRLSAAQAVELALKQRTEILNAQLDLKNQVAYNREITGAAHPQANGTFGVQKFFNIPVTVLPDFISPSVYGVLTREQVQAGNGQPIKAPDSYSTFPARFGVPWQASLGFSVQQLLFQPDVFVGLKARKSALELYQNQVKIQVDSVKSNVYRSYYGVLIAQKGLGFARESEVRLKKLYADQEQLFKQGFIERLDLDKTKVSLNNLTTTVFQLQNLVDLSYAGLKFALAIPQQHQLVLTDSLSMSMITKDVFALQNDFKYENRSEVQTLQSSAQLLNLQVQRYKLNAYPTVAAGWNFGTVAQRNSFNFFNTRESWFFNNAVGLNITMPLYDGGQRRQRIQQAMYAAEKNANTISQVKQVIDLEIVLARTQLTNAISAINVQEDNKALAEKVYETTKIKYEKGLGSSFEVLQSETSLQESLNNYYQALYNAVIARIGYSRALGKL
ncbi:MAG: TolC family protein [Bacteroidetes bacterium]|nr:MAG: TolC family protein [Bacteroidota bacterium]